jgi:hypothetical protein
MRIAFSIFLILSATICYSKETFLDCSIQGTETYLTNTLTKNTIPPTKSSVKIVEIDNELGIFIQGPGNRSSTAVTHKLEPSDSYENLSTNSEYNLIYISEKLATVIKIDRASGMIKIEEDFQASPQSFSRTRLYGSCNKIDKLKF